MSTNNFKIGDIVSWILHSHATNPNKYEIIGTIETPYDGRAASTYNQPITVDVGNDYLLKPLWKFIQEEKFHTFFLPLRIV